MGSQLQVCLFWCHFVTFILKYLEKQSILSSASTSTPTFERICTDVWSWYSGGTKSTLISNVSCKCEIDVYSNGVVCRAYVLGTYYDLSVSSFSLPIHRTSPEFLWKSYHTPISHLLHSCGLRCENNVMFLPWKPCVDDSGVHFASFLVPCRPLASR